MGDDAKASETYAMAIHEAPLDPSGYLQQASALANKGDPVQAVALLDRGMTAGAPREPLLLAKAIIEGDTGHTEEALAAYRDILTRDSQSIVAANNLTSLLADRKPLDASALKEARNGLLPLARTNSPAILDTLAWADYRLNAFSDAKLLLERAQAGSSGNPQVRFHYGAVLIALGAEESGRSQIKAVLDRNFPGRIEAEGLVLAHSTTHGLRPASSRHREPSRASTAKLFDRIDPGKERPELAACGPDQVAQTSIGLRFVRPRSQGRPSARVPHPSGRA